MLRIAWLGADRRIRPQRPPTPWAATDHRYAERTVANSHPLPEEWRDDTALQGWRPAMRGMSRLTIGRYGTDEGAVSCNVPRAKARGLCSGATPLVWSIRAVRPRYGGPAGASSDSD